MSNIPRLRPRSSAFEDQQRAQSHPRPERGRSGFAALSHPHPPSGAKLGLIHVRVAVTYAGQSLSMERTGVWGLRTTGTHLLRDSINSHSLPWSSSSLYDPLTWSNEMRSSSPNSSRAVGKRERSVIAGGVEFTARWSDGLLRLVRTSSVAGGLGKSIAKEGNQVGIKEALTLGPPKAGPRERLGQYRRQCRFA